MKSWLKVPIRPYWLIRYGAFVVVSMASLLTIQQAAGASTCSFNGGHGGNGHYYVAAQATSSYVWDGARGYVSVDAENINAATFQINWLGDDTSTTDCYNGSLGGDCSIQTGYGIGNVGGFQSSASCSGYCGYMEEEDVNGYDVNWNPQNISLTQDDFVQTNYAPATGNGSIGEWDAFIRPQGQSTLILTGKAYIYHYGYTRAAGEGETYYGGAGTCASVAQYQYYGTDGSGHSYSGDEIDLTEDSQNWYPWSSNWGGAGLFADAPYNSQYVSGQQAWQGWGS